VRALDERSGGPVPRSPPCVGAFPSGPACLSMRSLAKIQVIKRFFVNFMCVSDRGEGARARVGGGEGVGLRPRGQIRDCKDRQETVTMRILSCTRAQDELSAFVSQSVPPLRRRLRLSCWYAHEIGMQTAARRDQWPVACLQCANDVLLPAIAQWSSTQSL
jgi:hypothetical protein